MQDITYHISIHAPAASIYHALTNTIGIGSWWASATGHGSDGHHSRKAGNEQKVVTTVRIDELVPPRRISWTVLASNAPGNWQGSTITFELQAHGGDTELSFIHHGIAGDRYDYNGVKKAWMSYMVSLKLYIETGAGI